MTPERRERIEQICEAALDRDASVRAAFLAHACAGDEALRREVESLLAHEHAAEHFIGTPALQSAAESLAALADVAPGEHIGSYEVVSLLGSGGMGDVYRARDPQLARDVAIKVLPPIFSTDPERMIRFEREARVLASLNHPNIGAIYGLERTAVSRALVLELVEGQTLDDRLRDAARRNGSGLALPDALAIGRQIASALEAAHEKGIVHRDLKPANIKITPDGTVKVLDFGLAKLAVQAEDGSEPHGSDAPGVTVTGAREGVVLGTVAYMSPEQARGQAVDKRTDIWAFGCVLYEMLTGRAAFARETVADTMGAVVNADPDWRGLPADTPGSIRRLLRRCLRKPREGRLRDIGDAALEIEEAQRSSHPDAVLTSLPTGSYVPQVQIPEVVAGESEVRLGPPGARAPAWMVVGGMMAVAALVLVAWSVTGDAPAEESGSIRFVGDVRLTTAESPLASDVGTDVVLSPDGTRVVFVVRGTNGRTRLMTRLLAQMRAIELPGTEGARSPFLSPDGRWVGFWADGTLKKTSVDGGAPVALCDANTLAGASWGDDDTIVAALTPRQLSRLPSSAGTPIVIADFTEEAIDPRWPQVLPGGRHVLFTAVGIAGPGGAAIAVLSLADGSRTVLREGGTFGRYVEGGYLIYVNQGTLFAVPMDLDRMATRGTAVAVLGDLAYDSTFGFAHLDISRTGMLVYRRRGLLVASWIDRSGRSEPLLTTPGDYRFPRLSPDGQRLALTVTEGGTHRTHLFHAAQDRVMRLPIHASSQSPTWTPDGRFLVTGGSTGLHWTAADNPGRVTPLLPGDWARIPWSFTTDGSRLAYHERSPTTGWDLWTVPVRVSGDRLTAGEPEAFLATKAYETYPAFSLDGRWLAYASNEYGRIEVYVRPFPDDGRDPVRVSASGGRIPRWSSNGRQLVYRTDDHRLMVTDYAVDNGRFVAETPREWSPTRLADTSVLSNFDLHPDGQRIVALVPAASADQQRPTDATFVTDFGAELRQHMSPR